MNVRTVSEISLYGEEMFDTDFRSVNGRFPMDILTQFRDAIEHVIGGGKTRIGEVHISESSWIEYLEIDLPRMVIGARPIGDICLTIITGKRSAGSRSIGIRFKFSEKGLVMRQNRYIYPHAKRRNWCLDGGGITQISMSLSRRMIVPAYFLSVHMIESSSSYDVYHFVAGQMMCLSCGYIPDNISDEVIVPCSSCKNHVCVDCQADNPYGRMKHCQDCSVPITLVENGRAIDYSMARSSLLRVEQTAMKLYESYDEWRTGKPERSLPMSIRLHPSGSVSLVLDCPDENCQSNGRQHAWRDLAFYGFCGCCGEFYCPSGFRLIRHVCKEEQPKQEEITDDSKKSIEEVAEEEQVRCVSDLLWEEIEY